VKTVAPAAVGLLVGVAACDPASELPPPLPDHLCATEEQVVDLAPPEGDYGDLASGSDLWCGNPPQGGAPYSPFRVRLQGPEAYSDGIIVELTAVDADTDELLADTEVAIQPICANVGESAKWWVGSEAHMRYDGWSLPDLDGRDAVFSVVVNAIHGDVPEVEADFDVTLVLQLE
jgi:hypothetical protein